VKLNIKIGTRITSKTGRRFIVDDLRLLKSYNRQQYHLSIDYEPKDIIGIGNAWRELAEIESQVKRRFWTLHNPSGLLEFRRRET